MEDMKKMGMEEGRCGCPHHKMIPGLIVVFAIAFLLKAYGVLSAGTVDILWPILVGLAGLMKMFEYKCKCCPGHHGGTCY